ncbi:MAG: hypothetical protein IJ678_09065, partial [Kiritimatiellae bacterium]|nr:hypothetical protein [Kiritimatiellia bacterium]
AAALDSSRGMHVGTCLLPESNRAWEAVKADAEARGLVPKALALPVWPGDSSWSSVYMHSAMQSGVRTLNGYAAVTRPEYVEGVFHRFETMTEGDFTDDQAAGLREYGVTAVILQENAFPAKVSPFPFGATLSRALVEPGLRFLASDRGAWAFAVEDPGQADLKSGISARRSALCVPEFPTKFWRVDPPSANAPAKVRSFAEIRESGGYGWLYRAERPDGAEWVWREAVPGTPDAPWVRFDPPEGVAISYLAYARSPELFEKTPGLSGGAAGLLSLPAAAMRHEFGTTVVAADGALAGLRFEPGFDPPCIAVEGPDLPLPLEEGRTYEVIVHGEPAAAFTPEPATIRADGRAVSLRVHWDGRTAATLESVELRGEG